MKNSIILLFTLLASALILSACAENQEGCFEEGHVEVYEDLGCAFVCTKGEWVISCPSNKPMEKCLNRVTPDVSFCRTWTHQ